jgi:hypothetical protein
MHLTAEQVMTLAPDASAATAGRKLATLSAWQHLGRSDAALWGECRGSTLYRVRVDLADLTVACSCPSRKFPCKHGLGLLLIAANDLTNLPEAAVPDWVTTWLEKRATRVEQRAARAETPPPPATSDQGARAPKRGDQRAKRVTAGMDTLDLWLSDLMRNGLASVATQPTTFWEQQAARMVDAQAPGIAARLRRMAGIPNATKDWPERLLRDLGRLALLMHAYRRLDALDPALREDVRAAIGWTLKQEEVAARGETVTDTWHVVGQSVRLEGRLRTRSTWLHGERSDRFALVLQFAVGGMPFEEMLPPGVAFTADAVFWPGAYPLRALLRHRRGGPAPVRTFYGSETIADYLSAVADALARQPWLDRFPAALRQVIPLLIDGQWYVRDCADSALPLAKGDHWLLLALSGGLPVDCFGEWDGEMLLPLGTLADGTYHALGMEA